MASGQTDYNRRLEKVLEVCRNLSANLELEPLLNSIIEAASELTYSESSSILIYDQENNYLRFLAAPFYLIDKLRTIGVPLDRSVAGWVFSNAQTMALHHSDKDSRIFRVVDMELDEKTRSLLAVPLVFKGKAIGVLESINKHENSQYSEEDVTILETLASQAAVVVQNHTLLEDAKHAYEKVMELDRMKSDFIAIASHELRTPLGLVLGHSSVMLETANDEQRQDLQVIADNAMRLKEIIEQFSDVDTLATGLSKIKRTKVAIMPVIQEVVNAYLPLAGERKISLGMEVTNPKLLVEGDRDKITMALRNIVQNALTFTNESGAVKVKGEQVPGYIKISVIDNGIGIPKEEQQKIFQRFYQVESHLTRKHGGMGLGLSIAREMIEMHGGKIWVDSIEGKGSKFMLFIPQNKSQFNAAEFLNTGSLKTGSLNTGALKPGSINTGSLSTPASSS